MKRITSGIVAAVIGITFASQAFSQLGLQKTGVISAGNKLDNAEVETATENIFTAEGSKFILLDSSSAETDGFFVMTEELYGTSKIDRTPGISANSSIAKFDAEDENNIAYWLNNDFLQNGNGEYKLPDVISDNILTHTWQTEPSNAEGFGEEYSQDCKLALLSDYEYRKYIDKIGHTPSNNNAVSFYLRTACAEGVGNSQCYALAVSFRTPGTTVSPKATVEQYIRPVFYLSAKFFEENRVETMGENVLNAVNAYCSGEKLSEIYSKDEMDTYFKKPAASITNINGNVVEGGTLIVKYDYDYFFDEGNSKILWYVSDNEAGVYEKAGEGAEFILNSAHVGKYIKVSVTPIGIKGANCIGVETLSDFCIGPVSGIDSVEKVLEELLKLDDMTQMLQENNNIFGLDLSLLSEGNKEFIFESIRKGNPKNIDSLSRIYNDAVLLYKVNSCEYEDFEKYFTDIISEEVAQYYSILNDDAKMAVFNMRVQCYSMEEFFAESKKAIVMAALEFGESENVISFLKWAEDLFSVSFESLDGYKIGLIGASLLGKHYNSFSELVRTAEAAGEKVKSAYKGEPLLGLNKANRIPQTAPLDGAVSDTPDENIFSYDGQEFIILDKVSKNGETYLFIMTKDYYGTHAADSRPGRTDADAQAKYDINDVYNIAYWLNHDFLFYGNRGKKLPKDMIKYMDIAHVWHTEPCNVEGYGKEHLDVGPIALLSNYEWTQYIKECGTDTSMKGSVGALLRTARAGAVTSSVNMLMTYFEIPGSTLERNARLEAYIRPVFYMSTDFFAENKVSAIGSRLADIMQSEIGGQTIRNMYTEEELNQYFKKPSADNVTISGYPVTGEVLTVGYEYISDYSEEMSKIEWLASDSIEGEYKIIGEGKTLSLGGDMSGKYIKVRVTPVSSAKINSVGAAAECKSAIGAVVSETELLDRLNAAADTEIFEVLNSYKEVISLDLELSELENKQRVAQMLTKAEFKSVADIFAFFDKAVMIEKINEAEPEEIKVLLEEKVLGIDSARYAAFEDKDKLAQAMSGNGFNDFSVFSETVYKNMALLEFKTMDRTKVKDFLKFYDFIFEANISVLSDSKLGDVGIKILKNNADNFETLDQAVTASVKAVESENNSDNGNKVSSGGGGGVSRGTSVVNNYVNENQNPELEKGENEKQPEKLFRDLDNVSWAADKIELLAKRGIISGVGEGLFEPNGIVTREQFVQMAVLAFGLPKTENYENKFTDVSPGAWYAEAVAAAAEKEIIMGISDTLFGIGLPVTRQDVTAISCRLLASVDSVESEMEFADDDLIADYAKKCVYELYEKGIISGYEDNTFRPRGNASRAEAAVIIYGLLEEKGEI